MKGLKLKELKEGHIYKCLLSGYIMLIDSIDECDEVVNKVTYHTIKVTYHTITVKAKYYNKILGRFDQELIYDYQLAEIDEPQNNKIL